MSRLSKSVSRQLILGLCIASVLMWAVPAGADTIFHYRFEDTPGFYEDSGPNDMDLQKVGAGTLVNYVLPGAGAGSKFGDPIPQTGQANAKAVQFDETACLRANDDPALSMSKFTFESYLNLSPLPIHASYIASQWESNNRSWAVIIWPDGEPSLMVSSNKYNSSFVNSGLTLTPGRDYFFAVSYDPTAQVDGVKFYLEDLTAGTDMQTVSYASPYSSLADAAVSLTIGGANTGPKFSGLLDEVRMSNVVLSQDQLLAVPEPGTLTLLAAGLIGLLAYAWRKRK